MDIESSLEAILRKISKEPKPTPNEIIDHFNKTAEKSTMKKKGWKINAENELDRRVCGCKAYVDVGDPAKRYGLLFSFETPDGVKYELENYMGRSNINYDYWVPELSFGLSKAPEDLIIELKESSPELIKIMAEIPRIDLNLLNTVNAKHISKVYEYDIDDPVIVSDKRYSSNSRESFYLDDKNRDYFHLIDRGDITDSNVKEWKEHEIVIVRALLPLVKKLDLTYL